MSKYQELFNKLKGNAALENANELKLVKEIVDKAIAKKPLDVKDENLKCFGGDPSHGKFIVGACPRCNLDVQLGMNYCSHCGQAIDWEDWCDEDE